MAYFNVIQSGILSLIQDKGRTRFLHAGMAQSGAMDGWSAYWANKLCGNPRYVPLIEISMGGIELEASDDTTIVVTGADTPAWLNQSEVSTWQTLHVRAGDKLKLGYPKTGLRNYIAVRGGFQVKPLFGSASASLREGVGGHNGNGSLLSKGEKLLYMPSKVALDLSLPTRWREWWKDEDELLSSRHFRLMPCNQYHSFPKSIRRAILSEPFTVSADISRMGYRLTGPSLSHALPGMMSEATALGAIQLPPSGEPIVLLNDRQTLGGYPKVGALSQIDCWRLSQKKPNETLYFQLTSIVRAQLRTHSMLSLMDDLSPHSGE